MFLALKEYWLINLEHVFKIQYFQNGLLSKAELYPVYFSRFLGI